MPRNRFMDVTDSRCRRNPVRLIGESRMWIDPWTDETLLRRRRFTTQLTQIQRTSPDTTYTTTSPIYHHLTYNLCHHITYNLYHHITYNLCHLITYNLCHHITSDLYYHHTMHLQSILSYAYKIYNFIYIIHRMTNHTRIIVHKVNQSTHWLPVLPGLVRCL